MNNQKEDYAAEWSRRLADEDVYRIGPRPGYSPQIGQLVAMMGYARHTTLAAVRGLTIRELDVRFDEASNSIGMLLGHMAAVEAIYQVLTFDGRSFTEEEESRWGPGLQLGEEGARVHRGRSLDEYLADLEEVRGRTLRELARLGDDWLFVETPFWYDKQANNYFKWFHVIEDELSHRGQIRWLRRRLAEAGEA